MTSAVLAHLECPHAAPALLRAAGRAAALMKAPRIDVLAVRAPSIDMIAATEGFVSFQDDAPARAAEDARMASLKSAYTGWAAGVRAAGMPSAWHEREGRADHVLEDWAAPCGLIVLQRPGTPPDAPDRHAAQAALFDTMHPALVVPAAAPQVDFGRRIAIAWRNDARTVHAVQAALQWLRGAEIHVLAGAKRWEAPPALPPLFAEAGMHGQLHILPMTGQRTFGETLLGRARELQVDLLVLGAFAHPMLFGPLLGGVTKHILANADLPVLMQY